MMDHGAAVTHDEKNSRHQRGAIADRRKLGGPKILWVVLGLCEEILVIGVRLTKLRRTISREKRPLLMVQADRPK